MDASTLQSLSLETLQLRLAEALEARHQLALGRRAVEVSIADQRTRFTESESDKLDAYITALQVAIRSKEDPARPAHAPIYVDYGGR